MRAALLLAVLLSAPAVADPGYTPAYSQTDALQAKAQLQASNMAFLMCMACPAVHQAWKAAELAKQIGWCAKDFAQAPQMLAKCQQFWQTYLN